MFIDFSKQSANNIRIIRFVVGLLFTIALSFGVNWPLGFITPVFVAKFLGSNAPKMSFKVLGSVFSIILIAFVVAILLTRLFLPYPVVFILVISLTIFWISYWNNSGGNEFAITMLLVGLTVIPMLALLHQAVAEQFIIGFLISCLLSIFITMMMHEIVPDNVSSNNSNKKVEDELKPKATRVQLALLSTIILMPAMVFFFYANLADAVLILAFIAILAQKPDLIIGVKGSKALMVGNTIGGVIAIAMFSLLVVVPTFSFLLLLFALVIVIFSRIIFSNNPLAPLYSMALTTVIILLASSTLGEGDAGESFYQRILQIGLACSYIVFATMATSPLFKKINYR